MLLYKIRYQYTQLNEAPRQEDKYRLINRKHKVNVYFSKIFYSPSSSVITINNKNIVSFSYETNIPPRNIVRIVLAWFVLRTITASSSFCLSISKQ